MVQIQTTKDYGIFKLMTGNRRIDTNHVAKLKKEMLESGNLMEVMPILVNENMYIIDGQHRFTAAKDIGFDIHYIMSDNANISTARHMNVTQKTWDIMDFARSYAEGGNKAYSQFLTMRNKFPSLSASVIVLFMVGRDAHGMSTDFRRGLFTIDDIGSALSDLEKINRIRIATNTSINMPMARAFLKLLRGDSDAATNFDFERLMKKLETSGGLALYGLSASTKQSLQTLESVYNFQSPVRTVLY